MPCLLGSRCFGLRAARWGGIDNSWKNADNAEYSGRQGQLEGLEHMDDNFVLVTCLEGHFQDHKWHSVVVSVFSAKDLNIFLAVALTNRLRVS